MDILRTSRGKRTTSLRVAYFSNQFADDRGYGIARYSRELFEALRVCDDTLEVTPVSAWSSMDDFALESVRRDTGLRVLPTGRTLTPIAWTMLNSPKIESMLPPVNLVHAVSLGYPVATNKPFIVTVHDLGPLTHPEFFSAKGSWIMKQSLKQATSKADAIICVSEATADELDSYTGGAVSPRVSVIREGVSPFFLGVPDQNKQKLVEDLGMPDVPFILSAGAISPRKNVVRMIRALARLQDKIPHHLVLAGGEGWSTSEVHSEVAGSTVADRVHLIGRVSDDVLRALFSSASVYLHPSLYEGFGLTLLEAMAQGCPVITSNVSSLTEVAGDAAILVDPTSVTKIGDAIEAICTDERLSSDLRSRGAERIKSFSWSNCAKEVAEVYREVSSHL